MNEEQIQPIYSEQPIKKKSKWWIFILIFILIMVLLGSYFFIFNSAERKSKKNMYECLEACPTSRAPNSMPKTCLITCEGEAVSKDFFIEIRPCLDHCKYDEEGRSYYKDCILDCF